MVIFNATTEPKKIDFAAHDIDTGAWSVYINERYAGTDVLATIDDGKVTVAPVSAMVLAQ